MNNETVDRPYHLLPIKTVDKAVSVIRRIAIGLYLIAILNLLIAIHHRNPAPAIDAWVLFSLGATLQHCKSRIIAFLIIPYCVLIISSNLYCQYYLLPSPRSIILAGLGVLLGGYALIATLKYHKLRRSHINWKNGIIKTIQAVVYGAIFLLIASFGVVFPYQQTLLELGGYNLIMLLLTMIPSIAMFLAFNGWLPFTHNEPACRYDD